MKPWSLPPSNVSWPMDDGFVKYGFIDNMNMCCNWRTYGKPYHVLCYVIICNNDKLSYYYCYVFLCYFSGVATYKTLDITTTSDFSPNFWIIITQNWELFFHSTKILLIFWKIILPFFFPLDINRNKGYVHTVTLPFTSKKFLKVKEEL